MVEINIAQAKSYLMQKLAQEEMKKNSLFVATISHELRTPLASIIGWSDMMLHSHDLPKTTKHQVEIIKTSGNHLLLLVNDILDFAKLDNDKFTFENEPFDLRQLLESTKHHMNVLKHEGVDYKLNVKLPTAQHVIGDSHRLLQCLTNLLSNAAKFTTKGRISLNCTEVT
jgi:signal transduction histidine kinase